MGGAGGNSRTIRHPAWLGCRDQSAHTTGHIHHLPYELLSIIISKATASSAEVPSSFGSSLADGSECSPALHTIPSSIQPCSSSSPSVAGSSMPDHRFSSGGGVSAVPLRPQPQPVSRPDMAAIRQVCRSWRQLADQQLAVLHFAKWPCPFHLPTRFPNVQVVRIQQLQCTVSAVPVPVHSSQPTRALTPGKLPASSSSARPASIPALPRRHTRSLGPPITPGHGIGCTPTLAAALARLPLLHTLVVEQAGPSRGRGSGLGMTQVQSEMACLLTSLKDFPRLHCVSLTGAGVVQPPAGSLSGAQHLATTQPSTTQPSTSSAPSTSSQPSSAQPSAVNMPAGPIPFSAATPPVQCGGSMHGALVSGPRDAPGAPPLQQLVVQGTRLRGLPLPLSTLSMLRVLRAPQLTRLTLSDAHCAAMSQLQELDLSGCGLVQLPSELGRLSSLTLLNVSSNKLTALPASIGQLTALVQLEAGDNQLGNLPVSFCQLSQLTDLNLSGNSTLGAPALEALPLSMPALLSLDVSETGLPAGVRGPVLGAWPKLRTLLAASNDLAEVPGGLQHCPELHTLVLDHNELTSLPSWLAALRSLTHLDVSSNRLACLPPALADLHGCLRTLLTASNQLTDLPPCFSRLTSLVELDLSDNKLGPTVPAALWACPQLETLVLGANRIRHVAQGLLGMTSLKWLDLSCNDLEAFPWAPRTSALTTCSSDPRDQEVFSAADAPGSGPQHCDAQGGSGSAASTGGRGLGSPACSQCGQGGSPSASSSSSSSSAPSLPSSCVEAAAYEVAVAPCMARLEVVKLRGNAQLLARGACWVAWLRGAAPTLQQCDLEEEEEAGGCNTL